MGLAVGAIALAAAAALAGAIAGAVIGDIAQTPGPIEFHAQPASFVKTAAVEGKDGFLAEAPAQDEPTELRVEVIHNADGSVTVPADQLSKISAYINRVNDENAKLRATVNAAKKRIFELLGRRCA